MSALHEAVARAAAYADWQAPPEITIPVGARHDRIAAAAIRVVLAEAQRAIERVQDDCDWRGRDALDMALAALTRLGKDAA